MSEKKRNYLFKMNVQPHILEKYSDNKEELLNFLIPQKFGDTFNNIFGSHMYTETKKSLHFEISKDYSEILNSELFKNLIYETDVLIKEYKHITQKFSIRQGINYKQDFIDLLEKLMEVRKNLISQFVVLSNANSRYTTQKINRVIEDRYSFTINSEVSKGIDHIRRTVKIQLYIEELLAQDSERVKISYNFDNERLSIFEENQNIAVDLSKEIEKRINGVPSTIGKININPIFDNLKLDTDKLTTTIEIQYVYPNGSTSKEEDILLGLVKSAKANEGGLKLKGSREVENEELINKSTNLANGLGQRGYLKDVKGSGAKSVISWERTTIKFE